MTGRGRVSPGLIAGGGLKQLEANHTPETIAGLPRPHRRGRIETLAGLRGLLPPPVSPGLIAGGGLKLCPPRRGSKVASRLPRPHRRGRIETFHFPPDLDRGDVSP